MYAIAAQFTLLSVLLLSSPSQAASFTDCRDCPQMVSIPTGTFDMGAPAADEAAMDQERPQTQVDIAKPFSLSQTEITIAQFRIFANETGYTEKGCMIRSEGGYVTEPTLTWQAPGYDVSDDMPATCISWSAARAYAFWLAGKTGKPYRLPSEAELEYASRAGQTSRFPWGDDAAGACAYANVRDKAYEAANPAANKAAAPCTDGFVFTAPVRSFKPNAYDLYDLTGNAWEWAEDCYTAKLSERPAIQDGFIGDDKCERRVIRGGGYGSIPKYLRASMRGKDPATFRFQSIGFRVARDVAHVSNSEPRAGISSIIVLVPDLENAVRTFVDVLGYQDEPERIIKSKASLRLMGLEDVSSAAFVRVNAQGHFPNQRRSSPSVSLVEIKPENASASEPQMCPPPKSEAGRIILSHVAVNLDRLVEKVKAGGYCVAAPVALSASGRSRTFVFIAPGGVRVEAYEYLVSSD